MKKLMPAEHGFIPLLLLILAIVVAVIVVAYLRVHKLQQ
jgi:hypothetical protein